jgi:putative transcriptional regulator
VALHRLDVKHHLHSDLHYQQLSIFWKLIIGHKLLQSVREMKANKRGRVTSVAANDVAQARHGAGLSQAQFAEVLGISKRTLQEWEQGRRSPSGAAQTLIRIVKRHPEVVREALS